MHVTGTVVIVAGLLAAGCAATGTSSSSSSSPPAGGSSAPSAPGSAVPSAASPASGESAAAGRPARCHTGQLAGRVRMLDAAAGNRYAALVLTNTSAAACRTYGYVGLQLTGADGAKLPTSVSRESRPGPHGITLRPGGSAWARIHWTVASGPGEPAAGPCEPQPARLLVIPPDERTQLAARWPAGPVCDHGKIFVTALSLGTG
ncbi:MAG TPA: DUF4232 domain-containing protein [Streptosporangiaceae bacterium]|nr:DUF4232 domain-containing protein [Streptosporangiaceae bacterium]